MTAPAVEAVGGDYSGGFAAWSAATGDSDPREYVRQWGGELRPRRPLAAAPDLPAEPDDGLTQEEHLAALVASAEPSAGAAPVSAFDVPGRFPDVDFSTLWTKAAAPVEWLCEPLLIAGRAVALFSPAKAGKSLLCLEIAAALATGRPVLGNSARPPLSVVYVDLENTEDDLAERLTDLGYGPDDQAALQANLHYKSFPDLDALDSARGGAQLRAIAEHHDARLIVIDTVSRVIEGEENSADTFRALYRHAVMPLKAAGRAVLRLDHSGRDLTRGQRGSTGKVDDVDAVWQLIARPGGAVDLKRTHSRNRHGADRLTLARLADPLRHVLAAGAYESDVGEVLALLDRLEVPLDWGRDRIKTRLAEAGEKRGNDLLTAAIRERKRAADLSADRSAADPADVDLFEAPDSEGGDW